jgi:hypothetical protein
MPRNLFGVNSDEIQLVVRFFVWGGRALPQGAPLFEEFVILFEFVRIFKVSCIPSASQPHNPLISKGL